MPNLRDHVLVNCPFDKGYKPLFDAILFAITDGGEFRLAKSNASSRSDISAVKLDGKHKLPRFNMPLELGLF